MVTVTAVYERDVQGRWLVHIADKSRAAIPGHVPLYPRVARSWIAHSISGEPVLGVRT
jgi:hypothetical protein